MKLIQKISLLYLSACFFFVWGLATVSLRLFPYSLLAPAAEWAMEMRVRYKQEGKQAIDALLLHPQESINNYAHEGLVRHDPAFTDDGYLLISRFSKPHDQVIIELFQIGSETVLHTWVPDIRDILKQTPRHQTELNTWRDHRCQHPLLLENGDLIIKNSQGPMARIRPDGSVVWVVDEHFHHSVELNEEGQIVVPIKIQPAKYHLDPSIYQLRDDGIAWISQDGEVLRTESLMDLLLKAGYRHLVFGIGPWETDRIHLNDCQPVLESCGDARRGDILLSARNLSAVMLYRPAENRIVWLRAGPWLSQHDVNILPDGRYSIFGNDVIRFVQRGQEYANPGGIAEVYLIDPVLDDIKTPYSQALQAYDVRSRTQGRARVLENGDLFVEATDTKRLLRLTETSARWEYIPTSAPGKLAAIHWCRYLEPDDVTFPFVAESEH